MPPADGTYHNEPLTRFRMRCFNAAERFLIAWFAIYGLTALLIIPAADIFQAVSLSTPYSAGLASVLLILSGYVAIPYLRGRRPEIAPRRIWFVLALLAGIWGIELSNLFAPTLYNMTHARIELVPDAALDQPGVGPAVVIYGALSKRTPKMLDAIAQRQRAAHPGAVPLKTLYLSSAGGDAAAVLDIVKAARAAGIEQTIAFGDCASACAAMWLLMPHPQLAQDSNLCFHGAHLERSSRSVREIDRKLRDAIVSMAPPDEVSQQRATASLTRIFAHGLWELTCPVPAELVEDGLLAGPPPPPVAYPEGVARYVSANPPGCLAPRRMPKMPPAARDPKEDGCKLS